MSSNRPVGIYDSGLGGLTVFKEIAKLLPGEDLVYFGDTARVPYGSKSKETIIKYSLQIIRFLLKKKVKFIVIACNTASSNAYPELKNMIKVPLLDVIYPGIKFALSVTKNNRIGVIGTQATIDSDIYKNLILSLNKKTKVYQVACPLLVPLIEENKFKSDKNLLKIILTEYLQDLVNKIDTLILGCTHYPLIKNDIQKIFGLKVKLVDSAMTTAIELKKQLASLNLLSYKRDGTYSFYVSDAPDMFIRNAWLLVGMKIKKAQKINIEKY